MKDALTHAGLTQGAFAQGAFAQGAFALASSSTRTPDRTPTAKIWQFARQFRCLWAAKG
ncbi:MAG TPA: hypothetical protein VF062_19235 [Candidatus Limnocylindrales bacterium]